jgi:hypothetical protein
MAGLVPAIHVFLLRNGLEKIDAEMPQDVEMAGTSPAMTEDEVAEVGAPSLQGAKRRLVRRSSTSGGGSNPFSLCAVR